MLKTRRSRDPRARTQAGQVLVLVAIAAVVLIALAGLVIDSGRGFSAHRQAQNASDAAALAAAYRIYTGGTVTQATMDAQNVVINNGLRAPGTASCGGSPVSVCFYDSTGAATTTAASVATVKVQVSTSVDNSLMRVAGHPTTTIVTTSKAEVHSGSSTTTTTGGGSGSATTCVICVQGPTQSQALEVQGSAGVTVGGGNVAVNSNASNALGTGGISQSTPPVLTVSGGAIDVVGGYTGGTFSPAPTVGAPAFTDPFASLPEPTASGSCASGSTSCIVVPNSGPTNDDFSKSATVNPGVYQDLTVSGNNSTLTLTSGIYVITGQFGSKATTTTCNNCGGGTSAGTMLTSTSSGGGGGSTTTTTWDSDVIDAQGCTKAGGSTCTGVLIYFACPSSVSPYFTACTSATSNSMGGFKIVSQTQFLIKPMASAQNATYAGMSLFFSRDGTLNPDLDGGSQDSVTGSIYASNSQFSMHGDASAMTVNCVIDANLVYLTGNSGLTDNVTAAANATETWPATTTSSSSPSGPPALIS